MVQETGGQNDQPATFFAPAGRARPDALARSISEAVNDPLLRAIQESIDGFLMILNEQRQVLAVNRTLIEALGLEDSDCLLGKRPGEALDCVHVPEGPDGCGTGIACRTCGAVISILDSQKSGAANVRECLATMQRDTGAEPGEFRVRATPVQVGEHTFTVLVFNDISGDKRRATLERVFFHDILNTIGGLLGWSSLLSRIGDMDPKETAQRIAALSNQLARDVQDQRRLLQAERGEMQTEIEQVTAQELLDEVGATLENHQVARERELLLEPAPEGLTLRTDASLLGRVLVNMTKNALEATEEGGTVTVRCDVEEDRRIGFYVHNPGVIPEDVRPRIFQRSFSTKGGSGRGVGTHSMKLFGERYLGGEVGFTTDEQEGTVFFIKMH